MPVFLHRDFDDVSDILRLRVSHGLLWNDFSMAQSGCLSIDAGIEVMHLDIGGQYIVPGAS